ncbi:hypothetical protein BAUCODRAFT_76747 [Baudoinia panamericana UAMH 10762]|uniref:RNase III domain-containing protein n=1 Tax=Baudoinia panamericana (strain UAMH 10762) TaxID=717646 RepID=M2LFG9_BAUPA|nr:uncharacterized protein BAUCODRAFT_76747 [Baudoinia panamericana UAMH 10762]EMC92787.1 hypothetical protein BAUCODRAFT_76747 [Baudoinia panamericana UAMH 10762]
MFAAYHFSDPYLLAEALIPPGSDVTLGNGRRPPEANLRLAVLGASVIKTILIDQWYPGPQTRQEAHEAWLKKMIDKVNLTNITRKHVIEDACVQLHGGRGLRNGVGEDYPADAASLVQALIGAVWVDCDKDIDTVAQVMGVLGLRCPKDARQREEEAQPTEPAEEKPVAVEEEVIAVSEGSPSVM